MFQLTTSRRGRLDGTIISEVKQGVSTHDLTKRSTRSSKSTIWGPRMFQLTTSRRGRLCRSRSYWRYRRVSTHDLTKRSTSKADLQVANDGVSTHDLTKRSTTSIAGISQSTVFQLTTSRRGRHIYLNTLKEEAAFQLTTSRRGRRCQELRTLRNHGVSTHDLTKRSTLIPLFCLLSFLVSTHDLTKRSTFTRAGLDN